MSSYIVVEGVIGVGKTTLARYLQQALEADLVLERFDENPFLSNFYEDRALYGFQTQIFFLLSRYQQQQRMHQMPRPLMSDYLFAKDRVFANLNLAGDELATYEGVYQALAEKIEKPDLVIYLKASTPTLMNRIAQRDRPYERDMDESYIDSLRVAYDAFFDSYIDTPLLVVETDTIDFVGNEEDRAELMARIFDALARHKIDEHNVMGVPTATATMPDYDPSQVPLEHSSRQLPDFQRFHHFLDNEKGFNTDLLLNMLLLQEEVGELAKAMKHHWKGRQQGNPAAALDEIKSELSDVLAYLLKIANYTGIELEEAYLNKMAINRQRVWKSPEGH